MKVLNIPKPKGDARMTIEIMCKKARKIQRRMQSSVVEQGGISKVASV